MRIKTSYMNDEVNGLENNARPKITKMYPGRFQKQNNISNLVSKQTTLKLPMISPSKKTLKLDKLIRDDSNDSISSVRSIHFNEFCNVGDDDDHPNKNTFNRSSFYKSSKRERQLEKDSVSKSLRKLEITSDQKKDDIFNIQNVIHNSKHNWRTNLY